MRKKIFILLLTLTCSAFMFSCNKNDGSHTDTETSSENKENKLQSEDAEDEADTSDAHDAKDEDDGNREVIVKDLTSFKEFLNSKEKELTDSAYGALVNGLDEKLTYYIKELDGSGIKLNIKKDIQIEDNPNGNTYVVFKNLKKYNKNLNNEYYLGIWSGGDKTYFGVRDNFMYPGAFELLMDKLNVLNDKKRDIDEDDLYNNKIFYKDEIVNPEFRNGKEFVEFMDSNIQPDKKLNSSYLKEKLGERYFKVKRAVDDELAAISYNPNVLNMVDAEGKELGVVVTERDRDLYYLVGALDGEKITGHEYLLYHFAGYGGSDSYSGKIKSLSEAKAGPNGGGPIDESIYGTADED